MTISRPGARIYAKDDFRFTIAGIAVFFVFFVFLFVGEEVALAATAQKEKGSVASQTAAQKTKNSPKTLSKSGAWAAHTITENGQPVCYMVMQFTPAMGTGKAKRRAVTLMITHRPTESSLDVVSYSAGAKLRPANEVVAMVDGRQFNLFTQGATAWSHDAASDRALAAAIRNGAGVSFSGKLVDGQKFSDQFSLKGAEEAYSAISKACGVPVPEKKQEKKKPGTDKKTGAGKPTAPKQTVKPAASQKAPKQDKN